ncbi:MAG: hypothetical protein ACE5OR_05465 [bacterium]
MGKIGADSDDYPPTVPVVVPDLDEVKEFAAKLHAEEKAWKGEAIGWQAEYDPKRPNPPLDSKMTFTLADSVSVKVVTKGYVILENPKMRSYLDDLLLNRFWPVTQRTLQATNYEYAPQKNPETTFTLAPTLQRSLSFILFDGRTVFSGDN